MSWCYEHLKNRAEALHWAKIAQMHIGEPDKDWDDRVERLSRPRIALARPGAIGDVVMTLRLVPELKRQNPNCEIHYFTSPTIATELQWLMKQVGVDQAHDYAHFAADANKYERSINLVGYPLAEGYPEKPMAEHLLVYFARDMGLGLANSEAIQTKVECPPRLVEGRYITMQHQAGWSVYKQWSPEKWAEVISKLGLPVYQLGGGNDMKIPGANHEMMGRPLQDSIAMFANAVTHMGVDSWTNHLSGFTWGERKMRCCILWGSTQWQAAGYLHNFNISLHLACQPCFKEDPKISRMSRGPCNNPEGQTYDKPMHACMSGIGVERVLDNVQQLINWSNNEGRTGTV